MMRKKVVAIVACIAMLLTCFPTAGFAASSVKYWTWDQDQEKMIEAEYDGKITEISPVNLLSSWGGDSDTEYWYYVNGDVIFDETIEVKGDVHLILENKSSINAKKGIQIVSNSSKDENTLSIYSQSLDKQNMGKLSATGEESMAGIRCKDKCTLNIYGGEISAKGGDSETKTGGAGIGGNHEETGGAVNIYGGKILAVGANGKEGKGLMFYYDGAGIGGGYGRDSGLISIYGGEITAQSRGGAGIGGGRSGGCGPITILGGDISASSMGGAAIGSGMAYRWYDKHLNESTHITTIETVSDKNDPINIYAGNITAISQRAEGIGLGQYQKEKGEINIYGGIITSNGESMEPNVTIPVTGVSLNKRDIVLSEGQSETLTATVSPNNATNTEVTWTSDKEEVAKVENGKVIAVAPGEAIITVITKDGSKTATCKVTVNKATVPVTGVTLRQKEATLEVGKSLDLEVAVQPSNATNKNVIWKSSNEQVAKVNNGKVTAIDVGTAEITVTTVDGNKTATCKVTVTTAPVKVTGVTLDKSTATLKSGSSLTLKATVAPTNATNQDVSWSSSDTKVATVDSNGVVKAIAPGKATITVTTEDGNKTAKCDVTVEATNVAVTGVSLDKTSASLEVKDTLSLKATITPVNADNQNVIWSSSDDKIAMVKDGVVTAVAPGEAIITVKTVDGEKTATCKVTVKEQSSQPTNPSDPEDPSYQPDITDTDNGTVTVSPSNPQEGDKVTITPKPDQGYEVDDVVVTDEDGNELEVTENADGSFTFVQPEGGVTITVTFTESKDEPTDPADPSELPFGDVKTSDWFHDPVKYVYDKGLMTGTSATEFAPNLTTTRGMIVSILHRLEGGPVVENDAFSDVSSDDWYGQSVAWAASVGVVNGFEDGTFRPNDPITREQMAAILYNYSQYKGYDVSARADLSKYSDAASVSSWAAEVLSWANAEGLVNGMTKITLDPQASATRAQVATILMRYTQMIGE